MRIMQPPRVDISHTCPQWRGVLKAHNTLPGIVARAKPLTGGSIE
jgi:hypothetical protein